MTTLEDLYFGNIKPNERETKRGSQIDRLVKLMCKNEDALNATLTHPPTPMASVRAVMCMPKPTKNVKSSSKK